MKKLGLLLAFFNGELFKSSSFAMTASPSPGPLFANILTIRKDMLVRREAFSKSSPLILEQQEIPFAWLAEAVHAVRSAAHRSSVPAGLEPTNSTPFYCMAGPKRLEVISAGTAVVLLVDTLPVAEVDIKGVFGLAVFFEFPSMNRKEWDTWDLLGASTTHVEIVPNADVLCLRQVKQEEGRVNTLRLSREVNLSTGDTGLFVSCERHHLDVDPTLENLMEWIEVRAGTAHPSLLRVADSKRQPKGKA